MSSRHRVGASTGGVIRSRRGGGTATKQKRRLQQNRCFKASHRTLRAEMRQQRRMKTAFHQVDGGRDSQRGGKPQKVVKKGKQNKSARVVRGQRKQ